MVSFPSFVRAQVLQGPATSSPPEQWQMTLDGIKSRAQTLLIEHNGLQDEYRRLMGELRKLQGLILDLQNKNEQIDRLLRERQGRTDQQMRVDELTESLKAKRQQDTVLIQQLEDLKKKKADREHGIQLLKYAITDLELRRQSKIQDEQATQNPAAQKVDQLTPWRKQLEDANRQEVLLENELQALKSQDTTKVLNQDAIDEENKELQARLDVLRLQKLHQVKRASEATQAQANARRYQELKTRKDALEANINAYELRLAELKEGSLMALSWPLKKKKLIHEMVIKDARNNQIRDRIKSLHEDIDVLRDQVGRLERRINFVQDKGLQKQ